MVPQLFPPIIIPKEEAGKKLGVKNDKQKALSPTELANRLSYFIWGAPPDEELLHADLSKPDVRAFIHALVASKEFHMK